MSESEVLIQIGEFVVDPARNTLSQGDQVRQISGRLMDVLVYLATHNDRVVPAEELLEEFWSGRVVEESTVHRVINQLRKALNDSAKNPRYIHTVSKRGYQVIAVVSTVDAGSHGIGTKDPASGRQGRAAFLKLIAASALLASVFLLAWLWPDSGDRAVSQQQIDIGTSQDRTAAIRKFNSIAVLPFANMSADNDAGYFAEGLADNILDGLSEERLEVASRTAASSTVEATTPLDEIAERLGVSYLIEGSVQRLDDDVRIAIQLIRAADGYHVWSKVYDRSFTGGFLMQTEVSRNVVSIAQALLAIDVQRRHPQLYSHLQGVDPEAIAYYLDGQEEYVLYVHGEGGDWGHSAQLIRKAGNLDPDFLIAQQELAWSYSMRMGGTVSLHEAQAGAHAAMDKALALDPDNNASLLQLAQINLYLDLDYQAATTVIERALALYPRGRWWYGMLANIAFREGRETDAQHLLESAAAVNYEEEQVNFYRDQLFELTIIGHYQQALGVVEQALELVSGGQKKAELLRQKALVLILLERRVEAGPIIDEAWELSGGLQPEQYVHLLANSGRELEAAEILEGVDQQPDNAAYLALGYLALGDLGRSIEWLEAGIEEHDHFICSSLRLGRFWDPIRDDSRFPELIALLASKETRTVGQL